MNGKDLQLLQEAAEKVTNYKLQAFKNFIEHEKDLGNPEQWEILFTDTDYTKYNTPYYTVDFKTKGDYYRARYEFTWYSENDHPDHRINLLSLRRFADEEYTQAETKIPKNTPLFFDAAEKIADKVNNQILPPAIPNYFWNPDDY